VELFEEIRREYEFGVGTVQGVARKFGVHRRMVREALASAVPAEKSPPKRPHPRLGAVADFIDAVLEADLKAPRKQRHTAHRIYVRLCQERPQCQVGESTVRQYVRERRLALGMLRRETFVPQSYAWGGEAQVDWYEAEANLGGERQKLQVFVMRSMASGGAFHRAYLRATQQAFLEAHQLAFRYFGGVFARLRYDNLAAAMKRVLRGSRREETARFVAFRSHWRFQAEFCNPAEAHEKGGVEGEVGTFRRNHWVPVPEAADLADLNAQLLRACRQDEGRTIAGHEQTVGAPQGALRLTPGPVIEMLHLRLDTQPECNPCQCGSLRLLWQDRHPRHRGDPVDLLPRSGHIFTQLFLYGRDGALNPFVHPFEPALPRCAAMPAQEGQQRLGRSQCHYGRKPNPEPSLKTPPCPLLLRHQRLVQTQHAGDREHYRRE